MIALLASALGADLVVRGAMVYTAEGPPLRDHAVLVRDGKIAAIGPVPAIAVPPGARVFEGGFVTPGLVDGLGVAGLTGVLNAPVDQDHEEPGDPVVPELRAIDAYDPWEELVGWLREHGVTTIQTGPSPGAPVGGRTVVVHTLPGPVDEVALVADGMMVFSLGEAPKRFEGARTRMGSAAAVRQALVEAREYRERRKLPLADRPTVDLGREALVEVLEGRRRAVFVARRADDLLTALRIADEFELDAVLAGATEAYLVRDAIAAAKVPVLVGPTMARAWSDPGEGHLGSFEAAALLADAGVPIGLMSGYESYVPKVRVVLFEAAIAAANGLGRDRAIEAATLGNARILGIADRTGSLAVGKDADLVVFDGDPFETTSHVCVVLIGGVVASETCR